MSWFFLYTRSCTHTVHIYALSSSCCIGCVYIWMWKLNHTVDLLYALTLFLTLSHSIHICLYYAFSLVNLLMVLVHFVKTALRLSLAGFFRGALELNPPEALMQSVWKIMWLHEYTIDKKNVYIYNTHTFTIVTYTFVYLYLRFSCDLSISGIQKMK